MLERDLRSVRVFAKSNEDDEDGPYWADKAAAYEAALTALNCHADLYKALKAYVDACHEQDIKLGPITGAAKAALLKAEGK